MRSRIKATAYIATKKSKVCQDPSSANGKKNIKKIIMVKPGKSGVNIKKNKYNAVKTKVSNITFDSKKEAKVYRDLLHRKNNGEFKMFLIHTPFHLPGGVKYVCDFLVFNHDGTFEVIDVKGVQTRLFLTKKKMVEEIYGIKINIV